MSQSCPAVIVHFFRIFIKIKGVGIILWFSGSEIPGFAYHFCFFFAIKISVKKTMLF